MGLLIQGLSMRAGITVKISFACLQPCSVAVLNLCEQTKCFWSPFLRICNQGRFQDQSFQVTAHHISSASKRFSLYFFFYKNLCILTRVYMIRIFILKEEFLNLIKASSLKIQVSLWMNVFSRSTLCFYALHLEKNGIAVMTFIDMTPSRVVYMISEHQCFLFLE